MFFFFFWYWNIQMKQILTVISFRLVRTFIALLFAASAAKVPLSPKLSKCEFKIPECVREREYWYWCGSVKFINLLPLDCGYSMLDYFDALGTKKKKLKSPLTCNLNCLRILHFATTKTKTKNNSRKEVWPPPKFGCRIPLPAIDSARG